MAIQFDHTANGLVTITTTNAASPTPYTLRLPNGTGTNGQFLSTDGTGNLSFASAATTVAYNDLTTKPAVNVTFTGDVTGSGNVLLATSGTNLLSITMDLSDTGVSASTYGGANTFGVFTVDVEGRITSASNVTPAINYAGDVTSASKPAINLTFTGGVTGSGGVVLSNSGTNSLSIGLTVPNDSIALGTQTTGNYVANVVAGTGLLASGGGSEGSTVTVSLPNSGVTANTYGNARIVPAITVDAQGRITAASNVTFLADVANIALTGDVTGAANVTLGPGSTAININTTIQPNSVALGTDTTGQYVAIVNAGTAIVVTGTTDEGNAITIAHADTSAQANIASDNSNGVVIQDISLGFDTFGHVTGASVVTVDLDNRYLRLSGATSQTVQGNLVFEGNVNFLGNVFSTNANNLSIAENFIYLNDLDFSNNVDLGIVGNYNDGTYRHSGIFRDATDGYWKVFDNYTQEPGNAININTEDSSYREANFKANIFLGNRLDLGSISGNSIVATGNIFTSRNVIATAFRTAAGDTVWHSGNDGAGSGLDADLLDNQTGTYYLAWANQTGKPSLNLTFTGDVTGSGGVNLTNTDTNSLSIALTVAANSVALGADTTGNYTDRVVGGTGILATGTGDEGNVITVALSTSGVTAGSYGNANVVSQITVDAQGRITSAANVTINKVFNLISGNTITSCALTQHSSINTSAFNFFAGPNAGCSISTGGNNIFLGSDAGRNTTSSPNNIFIGSDAGLCSTSGPGNNIFLGTTAGWQTNTGYNNIFLGNTAGGCNTSGFENIALGTNTGSLITTGRCNIFIGCSAGRAITTGNTNIAIGINAYGQDAGSASTASNNSIIGNQTGRVLGAGCDNSMFGAFAGLSSCGIAARNTFLGTSAGTNNTSGSRNLYLGHSSGGNVTTGNDNIMLGVLTSCVGLSDASSNVIIFATGGIQRFCNNASLGNTTITGNIIAGSSGTFFGDGAGITGINYCNVTLNRPAANIILTGDLTGTANAILTPGSTVLSINATIASNSVALGTDTTGNYTDRVVAGTGITATGTADEGNVITVSLNNTAVSPSTYGGANVFAAITVDQQGRITSASNVAIAGFLTTESDTLATVTGRGATTATAVQFTNTTESTSTSTGAVRISGGLGVTGNLYVGRVIVSGTGHAANVGLDSAIIGGSVSAAAGANSFIGGGIQNSVVGPRSAIIGGERSTISGSNAFIAASISGSVTGVNGAVLSSTGSGAPGSFSTAISSNGGSAAGSFNTVLSSAFFSGHAASTSYSIVGGAWGSVITNTSYSTILGSQSATINITGTGVLPYAGSQYVIGSTESDVTGYAAMAGVIGSFESNTNASLSTIINGYYSRQIDSNANVILQRGSSQFSVGPYTYSSVSGKHVYAPRSYVGVTNASYGSALGNIWGQGAAQIGRQLLVGNLTGSGTVTLSSEPGLTANISNQITIDRNYTVYLIKGTAVLANITGTTKTLDFMTTAKRGANAATVAFSGSYGTSNAIINTIAGEPGTTGWSIQLVANSLGFVSVNATTNTTDNVKVMTSVETTEMQYYSA